MACAMGMGTDQILHPSVFGGKSGAQKPPDLVGFPKHSFQIGRKKKDPVCSF